MYGSIRSISRWAHREAWEERKRYRNLRRLTQQALRAKGRGDMKTMGRLATLLHKIRGLELFQGESTVERQVQEPRVFQKGKKDGLP